MPGQLISSFKKLCRKVIGDPEKFSLESRIFHSFSALAFVILPIEIFFNLLIDLPDSAIITIGILLIQLVLYYLSRHKGLLNLAVILSGIEIIICLGINYFYNSGIKGGTILLFAVSLFMTISVSQKNQWKIWLSLNLLVVLTITYLEYIDPSVIKVQYQTRQGMFLDIIGSYIIVIILLYVGISSIRQNYTAQKQLTDEKTLALEMLNAEKDKLFSIISHDLRSPLALTQQYFSILKEVELDNEERIALEKDLFKTINDAQDLLTNLLSWAKTQMERPTAQVKSIQLTQLLNKTADVFMPIALKKNIQLKTIIEKPITIKADTDMLQLVMRNLLNNAIKFTAAGGSVELKAVKNENECIISVKDTGIGIPVDKQNDIFSLKVNSTYGTENEKGTGLGLVLCKDYTLLQGGKIWFTSSEKGTTFFVSLPCLTG